MPVNYRVKLYSENPDGSVDVTLQTRSNGITSEASTVVPANTASGETPDRIAAYAFEDAKGALLAQNNYAADQSVIGETFSSADPTFSDIITPGHGEPAPDGGTLTAVLDGSNVELSADLNVTDYTKQLQLMRSPAGAATWTEIWTEDYAPGNGTGSGSRSLYTDAPGAGNWDYGLRHHDWLNQVANSNIETVTVP
jgi:hypothetical protein